MKRFLQKKWSRRLIQATAVVLSLTAVAYAVINWWGAGQKRDAIAEWQAAGRPLTVAAMLEPLPPDAENFAMLPIFTEVTREYAGQVDMGRPREGSLGYRMAEMGRLGLTLFKPERDKIPDFSEWARRNRIENQPALILQKFDEKNAEILSQLRDGLSRPYTLPPRWHRIANDPNALFEPGLPIQTLALINVGLMLRAEVAIQANQPEIALESVAIALRMAGLLAAENTFVGAILQTASCSRLQIVMARAMEQGIWSEQQLVKLRSHIATTTNQIHLVRPILDLETLAMIGSFTHYRHDRSKIAKWFGDFSAFAFTVAKTPVLRELVPAGWYDAFLARCIRMNREQINAYGQSDKSLLEWCRASAAVDASYDGRGTLSQALMPDNDMGIHPRTLRERISYATVKRAQALLACDLAIFQKKNGRYPTTLEELGDPAIIDPMTTQPFHYRPEGKGFVLYSSGIDGTDNGGDRGGERNSYWSAPDWVW